MTAPSTITATLDWDSSADLTLSLYDQNGTWVKGTGTSTAKPEVVVFAAQASGTWKVGVKAKTGSANYTVTVDAAATPSVPTYSHDIGRFATAEISPVDMARDELGNWYVMDEGLACIHKYAPDRTTILRTYFTCGEIGKDATHISRARGLGRDADSGDLWIADTSAHRLLKLDVDTGALLVNTTLANSPGGALSNPGDVAVDTNGNAYVIDLKHRIVKVSPTGQYVAQFGGQGSGAGKLNTPMSIEFSTIGQNAVYVTDARNFRVAKFSVTGAWLGSFGSQGTGNGQMTKDARGIAVDGAGVVYVADVGGDRVDSFLALRYTDVEPRLGFAVSPHRSARHLLRGPRAPRFRFHPGRGRHVELSDPAVEFGRHVDGATDSATSRLPGTATCSRTASHWTRRGTSTCRTTGTSGSRSSPRTEPCWPTGVSGGVRPGHAQPGGRYRGGRRPWVPLHREPRGAGHRPMEALRRVVRQALSDAGRPGLRQGWARDVGVDATTGRVYGADEFDNQLAIFSSSGALVDVVTRWGSGSGQPLGSLRSVDVAGGSVYVADATNRRIHVYDADGNWIRSFATIDVPNGVEVSSGKVYVLTWRVLEYTPTGTLIRSWSSTGTADGQLRSPYVGIAVDGSGDVYVGDSRNHRVKVFSP